jgi:hypothetical protein
LKSVSLPIVKGPNGERIFRHRYVDEVLTSQGPDRDKRLKYILDTFSSQPDLWRLPHVAGTFDKMKIECVDGLWTIDLEKK